MDNLITNSHVDEKEVVMLREKFTTEYCQKMGWDTKSLTAVQLLEISSKPEYKNPLMLRS